MVFCPESANLELISGIENFNGLILSTLLPVKPKGLTRKEREEFVLSEDLKGILVGLLLGDLHINKQKLSKNPRLMFIQGTVHRDYLLHLYELYKTYCRLPPVTTNLTPDKRTGKIYSTIHFNTYSLPCFHELFDIFYIDGKKIVPANIADLLTLPGLAYWICDDGNFDKSSGKIVLYTNGFNFEEVTLLAKTLTDKFNLKCTLNKNHGNFVIRISPDSVPLLKNLLAPHMPSMMLSKIGL